MSNRYSRQEILPEIGTAGQAKLANSHVLLIGAGGLGCPVLQYLGAAGVKKITVLDDDVVDITNLQRQVLFANAEVGEQKVHVAKRKIEALNPEVAVIPIAERLTVANVRELIPHCDLVIDGSDNFATTYLVNDACTEFAVPFISGSIFKFEGQVTICNVDNGPGYRCLFPEPPPAATVPACADIGVLGTVAGTVGCIMAQEALKFLAGFGELLSGVLLKVNCKDWSTTRIQFKKVGGSKAGIKSQAYYNSLNSCGTVPEITYGELQVLMEKEDVLLVDVRAKEEREAFHIGGEHVPLEMITNTFSTRSDSKIVVAYCAFGKRSALAAQAIKACSNQQFVYSLKGGVAHLETL